MSPLCRILMATLIALSLSTSRSPGQSIPGLPKEDVPFFAAALSQMISDTRSFTARAELTLPADESGEALTIPVGLGMRDGRIRMDLSLSKLAGSVIDPAISKRLDAANLDRVVILLKSGDPAKIAVPGMKSYTEIPMGKDSPLHAEAGSALGRLQKTAIANEVWDRHPCVKYRLAVTPLDGQPKSANQAFLWEASDLSRLGVRIDIQIKQSTYRLQFRDIRISEPDLRLFDIPEGYARHENPGSLLQAAFARMAGDGGKSGGAGGGGTGGLLEALLGL